MIRGETFTVALVFDSGYDTSRVEDMTLSIGNYNLCQLSKGTMTNPSGGQTFYGYITGEDTAALSIGERPMVLAVWDSQDGVRKAVVAIIPVQDTGNLYANETTGELANLVLAITYNTTNIASEFVIADIYMGAGLPAGGAVGLPLVKKSTDDFDAEWSGVMSGIESIVFDDNPSEPIGALKLQYNPDEKTLDFGLPDGGTGSLFKEMFEEYTNIDTVPLVDGMIVSTAAIPGNRKGIKRTDFTSLSSIRSIVGMVTVPSIVQNQSGRVTTKGIINNLNTNGIAEGAQLWGNPAVLGGWSGNKPAKPQYAVQIGQVVVTSATVGSVELNIAKDVKFSDLADVNGSTNLIDNADTIPKRDSDGIIREISVANVKAALKADTDLLYEPLLGFTPENTANKGQANGYASLDGDGLVPAAQLPSFVDDLVDAYGTYTDNSDPETIIELWTDATHTVAIEKYTGKIYVDVVTRFQFRWSGSVWGPMRSGPVQSVAGKTGNVLLVKTDVGLGNVDNTSDANKPVSTLQAAAIATKVGLTGNETVAGIKTFSSSPIVPNPTTSGQALNKGTADGAYVGLTGAQNIAGVKTFTDSPIVPTPVNNTDAANKAYVQSIVTVGNDTYQENKLITDARVASLENVINSANINQETTATVTGVDTVALPKTAANTGMQVQMFGQSAENLIVNGNFANGTTGWVADGGAISSTSNKLSLTGSGTTRFPSARKNTNKTFTAGDKLYFAARVRVTNSVCDFIVLRLRGFTSGTLTNVVQRATPVIDTWYNLTGIATANADWVGTLYAYIYQEYIDMPTASGKVLEVDGTELNGVKIINLTETFGAGNEPTKEQCDLLFANYFEGSDNVLGTGRIRSVNSAGLLPSYLYFNGGQLRSNGITKDEIRKGTNGYELVQRINPADGTVLITPLITPIAHAGLLNSNSNGTAYFEPIIADAGVYGANIAIQLTDYPIASFESIRKYANGAYTELNTAIAVVASGGLSFTHPDLVSGDLVMFTYAYNMESIGRSMTLTHYDSRFVIADTANSKVYRWRITSTNGVASIALTEV